jgi:basic membrane protein A and related proteins
MNRRITTTFAAFAALGLVAAACSSSKATTSAATTTATATTVAATATTAAGGTTASSATSAAASTIAATVAAATTAAGSATTAGGTAAAGGFDLDTNGDGKVVIGVATPGPRNDGGYYQALVTGVQAFSKAHGFADPIIVDNIKAEEAATQLDSLARQNVDMIAVGAGEIADPLKDLTAKYSKIVWYCNCGAGYPAQPNLIQQGDDGNEIGYDAGVATGLLMKAKGVTKAAMIGNNNLNFEKQAFMAFQLGLKSIDATYAWTYVATGSFNDVAAATEAYNNLKAQGVGAIWPYLGGSHEAVVKLADADGVIVMSAGASNACTRTDLKYDLAVKFDAGDYATAIFNEILAGKISRGETRVFHVGVDPQPGAQICNPTADETTAMDAAGKLISSGALKDQFDAISKAAYGG